MAVARGRRDGRDALPSRLSEPRPQPVSDILVRVRRANLATVYADGFGEFGHHVGIADIATLDPERLEDRFVEFERPV